jgi:hypothetical protein
LEPSKAGKALKHVATALSTVTGDFSAGCMQSIESLVLVTSNAGLALQQLPAFIPLGILSPFVSLLQSSGTQIGLTDLRAFEVDAKTIRSLVELKMDTAFELLAKLVEQVPTAAAALQTVLADTPETIADLRLLSSLEILMITSTSTELQAPQMAEAATSALADPVLPPSVHLSASRILCAIATTQTQVVVDAVLKLSSFTAPLAAAAEALARLAERNVLAAIEHVVDLGLKVVVRSCSSDEPLKEEDLAVMRSLSECYVWSCEGTADGEQLLLSSWQPTWT